MKLYLYISCNWEVYGTYNTEMHVYDVDKAEGSLHVISQIVRTQAYRETHMYVYVCMVGLAACAFKFQNTNSKQKTNNSIEDILDIHAKVPSASTRIALS